MDVYFSDIPAVSANHPKRTSRDDERCSERLTFAVLMDAEHAEVKRS